MRFELGSPDSGAGEKSQEGSEYFTAGSRAISTAGTVSAANRFLRREAARRGYGRCERERFSMGAAGALSLPKPLAIRPAIASVTSRRGVPLPCLPGLGQHIAS
jgi:hypothetical protein